MGAVVQQKGEALEIPGQHPGEAGRASLGRAAGRPGTALLWVAGRTAHAGDPLWYLWHCSPFPMFPPSLQVVPPALSALGTT